MSKEPRDKLRVNPPLPPEVSRLAPGRRETSEGNFGASNKGSFVIRGND